MKIALVNPVARRTQGYHTIGTHIPQLGLQVLARLAPPDCRVDIIDEIFGLDRTADLLAAGGYDLVGITSYTSSAPRAYELAAVCRERGIPCIMGGPHASALPDEALEHFDAVAVGECDQTWPDILADARAGRLRRRYDGRLADLSAGRGAADQAAQPLNGRYDVGCIQTSRGCPCGCDFCSVTRFNGPRIRRRPIADILDEWNRTTRKFLFVVDDNFFGVGPREAEWAKECLRAIIRHGKKRLWFSQTTVNMGQDIEALRLAHKAGCRGMLVGFESFNPESLGKYHKALNRRVVEHYRDLVKGFHRGGIAVFGGFIIGADEDDEMTAAQTALQAVEIGVDIIQITNLTPLPGTKIYERWMQEGRIFATDYPRDWERYTFTETVYNPRRISAKVLDEKIYEIRWAAARRPWVLKRTLATLRDTRSLTTALFVHGMNKGWAQMARNQVAADAAVFGESPKAGPSFETVLAAFAITPGRPTPAAVKAPGG